MTAASLMSHCLAYTNVLVAGADLFTESKLQLSAGTDSLVLQTSPEEPTGLIPELLHSWKVLVWNRW